METFTYTHCRLLMLYRKTDFRLLKFKWTTSYCSCASKFCHEFHQT